MRIAVLSDIHGNLLALDACLVDLEAQGGADVVAVAGDLCLPGPKPKKVLQRLEELGAACIRGNKDRFLCDGASDGEQSAADLARIDWTRRELGERWLSWLRELPFAMRVGEDDNQLLIVHANPRNDEEQIWPDADEATLDGSSARSARRRSPSSPSPSLRTDVARPAAGERRLGRSPQGRRPARRYAIFTERTGGWEVKHRRVAFDVKKVATPLSDRGIPESAELLATLRRHRYRQLRNSSHGNRGRSARQAIPELHGRRRYLAAGRSGRVFGFFGPNGAGRTTTINAIVGLARKSAGSIASSATTTSASGGRRDSSSGFAPRVRLDRYLSLRDVLIYSAGYTG